MIGGWGGEGGVGVSLDLSLDLALDLSLYLSLKLALELSLDLRLELSLDLSLNLSLDLSLKLSLELSLTCTMAHYDRHASISGQVRFHSIIVATSSPHLHYIVIHHIVTTSSLHRR